MASKEDERGEKKNLNTLWEVKNKEPLEETDEVLGKLFVCVCVFAPVKK